MNPEPETVAFNTPQGAVGAPPCFRSPARIKTRTLVALRCHRHRKLKANGRASYPVTPKSDALVTMLLDQGRLTDAQSEDREAVVAAITRYLDDAAARWASEKRKRVSPPD